MHCDGAGTTEIRRMYEPGMDLGRRMGHRAMCGAKPAHLPVSRRQAIKYLYIHYYALRVEEMYRRYTGGIQEGYRKDIACIDKP